MSLPLAWSLLCIGRVVLNFDSPGYEAKPRSDGRVAGPTPKAEGPPLRFEGRGGHLYANDVRFDVKGVNWYGSEGRSSS